jgi:hypothetical protein
MRFPGRHHAAGVARGSSALLLLALLGGPAPAGAFVYYYWQTGVSGLISDSSKWNPVGVPVLADRLDFNPSGTYTVTFPTTTPQTNQVTCSNGTVTFKVTSSHTTGPFNVVQGTPGTSLSLVGGTFNIGYLELGTPLGFSTLYVSADTRAGTKALVHSNGTGNPNPGSAGDQIGHAGYSEMYINGGGRYVCERTVPGTGILAVAVQPSSAATLTISGSSSGFPQTVSSLSLTGGASMVAGVQGTANIFVSEKGVLDAGGDLLVAFHAASNGFVNVGAAGSTSLAYLNAARLVIGGNLAAANNAGHGEVNVRDKGVVTVNGPCEVGDPDNDGGSLLRVQQGGKFTTHGGLKAWPTTGLALSLQGGLAHIQGGAFEWPAGKHLSISSTTGTPELRIDNGTANTGPDTPALQAQLFVGQGGDGTLTVSGAGTAFTMGPGSCVVAETAGGTGTIVVDAGAAFSSAGPMNVGNLGSGDWLVQGGSLGDVGTLAVGVGAGGTGAVDVTGAGSRLDVRDNLWIGGGYNGVGGTGIVSVDLGGRLEILHVTGINPALTTVHPAGTLAVSNSGLLTTTGAVSDAGSIVLADGAIEALNVTLTSTGSLRGHGQLTTMLQNAGQVDPGLSLSDVHTIRVDGNYTQFSQGHYVVDLDTSAGPQSDLLEIDGPATLAGTLDLRPAAGFAPVPGASFTLLTYTSCTGTFDAVTWNGSPLGGEAVIVYSASDVRAVIPGATAAGDPASAPPAELRFAATGGIRGPGFALDLPQAAQVRIRLYDVRGREVATLFEGAAPAGRRSFALQAGGRSLSSGVYFGRAVVESEGRVTTRTASAVLVR